MTGNKIIRYMQTLPLVGGDHDGKLFKVLPWERRFILGAFAQPDDAALTVPRGNGKSAVVAGLACAVVDPAGPLHGRRRHVDVFAFSFAQGRTIFEDVLASLGELYDLGDRKLWRKEDTSQTAVLEYRPTGARVKCVGSDPRKAHGLRTWLALLDEPAQWDAAKRDRMLAAIRTGLGKSPGSRLIALGTRPAESEHFFAKLLKTAGYVQVHAAASDVDPYKVATWRAANPSWAHLPSLRDKIRKEAKAGDLDSLASLKGLRLNLGVSEIHESLLLDAEVWARIEAAKPLERAGPYALGLDLGQNAAMSAAAGYWPQTGAMASLACFPEVPGLAQRGLADGVGNLYVKCEQRGELMIAGQFVSDVGALLRAALEQWGWPSVIVCDRWREGDLRKALAAVKFPMTALAFRGQGFRDGAEDVRGFRRAAFAGRFHPPVSLLLRSAMAEARAVHDPAGNAKLAKGSEGGRRLRARDDAVAALILAVAEGERRHASGKGRQSPGDGLKVSVVR